ncbi:mitochondrial carrier domain-containing protein [Globomyces pollinis-pini]|nr:mitochondrial carrier domain-containing protein [Globomyces pollinis-pini]
MNGSKRQQTTDQQDSTKTVTGTPAAFNRTPRQMGINFLAGGFALATAFAVMHPLDTLKTQLQTNTKSINWRTLGRGFSVSFLLAAPQGGLRLSSYEFTKSYLVSHSNMSIPLASALSACIGDTVSSIVKVPREVITARLQSGMDVEYIKTQRSNPAVATFKLILAEQGPRGLFRGFASTTARDWPFMVILFTTYESFKQHHHRFSLYPQPKHDSIPTIKSIVFGGISGALAGFLTTPFDVIKTNIMTQRGSNNSIVKVAKNIYLSNGPRSFFVGGAARSVWWFCVCSMFFPLYETGKDTLKMIPKRDNDYIKVGI